MHLARIWSLDAARDELQQNMYLSPKTHHTVKEILLEMLSESGQFAKIHGRSRALRFKSSIARRAWEAGILHEIYRLRGPGKKHALDFTLWDLKKELRGEKSSHKGYKSYFPFVWPRSSDMETGRDEDAQSAVDAAKFGSLGKASFNGEGHSLNSNGSKYQDSDRYSSKSSLSGDVRQDDSRSLDGATSGPGSTQELPDGSWSPFQGSWRNSEAPPHTS
jgi:hypothetical protein